MKYSIFLIFLILSAGLQSQILIDVIEKYEEIETQSRNDNLHDVKLLIESGKYRKALRQTDKELESNPMDPMLNYVRGFLLTYLRRYKKAQESLLIAISKDSTKHEFYREMGTALYFKRKYVQAIEYLEKAKSFRDAGEYVYSLNSFCKGAIEDYEGALIEINKAIELNNNEEYYLEYRDYLTEMNSR